MRIKRIVQGGISALAMGAFVVAMSPGSAQAINWDHGPMYSGDKGDKAASAYFEEHGDHVKVCDIDSDGKKAWVNVYDEMTNDFLYSLTDTKNDGKCSYRHASDGGKYNLPENHDIGFTVSYEPSNNPNPGYYIYFNDH
ncbi:hypothetical protein ACFW4X_11345 [Streptomyces smyrnaeus]|uniref:Uncharacterized protein n=1 Tax=Streptomyces smyrnaeus TaxID=1387713 RepID=A0ABS3XR65_9ACTN|nr:hypothetical protein [Streptomyces smyrnaeus]MBO8197814.1 hypothetical protein [Streptomyces smyrnaeus]